VAELIHSLYPVPVDGTFPGLSCQIVLTGKVNTLFVVSQEQDSGRLGLPAPLYHV
jgi:hypothetical protein